MAWSVNVMDQWLGQTKESVDVLWPVWYVAPQVMHWDVYNYKYKRLDVDQIVWPISQSQSQMFNGTAANVKHLTSHLLTSEVMRLHSYYDPISEENLSTDSFSGPFNPLQTSSPITTPKSPSPRRNANRTHDQKHIFYNINLLITQRCGSQEGEKQSAYPHHQPEKYFR